MIREVLSYTIDTPVNIIDIVLSSVEGSGALYLPMFNNTTIHPIVGESLFRYS